MCRYVDSKYIQIHADMHFYIGAYLTVWCSMNTAFSKHTYSYAQDTAHKKTQYIQIHAHICRYRYVHITYALCICDMHMDVCCAYPCVYVYVLFLHTYHIKQCIYCMYVGHICTGRITDGCRGRRCLREARAERPGRTGLTARR